MDREYLLALMKKIADERKSDCKDFRTSCEINDTIIKLEGEIRDENNKKSGRANLAKIAKDILKNAPANNEFLKYPYTAENGKQYVCDASVIFEFSDPMDLPEYPEKTDGERMERDKYFGNLMKILNNGFEEIIDEEVEAPTVNELKSGIKEKKAEAKINGEKVNGVLYSFGNGLAMNTRYILYGVEATGTTTLKYKRIESQKSHCVISCILMEGNGVRALMLPCNIKDLTFKGYKYFTR